MELTHSASAGPRPSWRIMVGRATLTMVASTMIIATPSATGGIISQRRSAPGLSIRADGALGFSAIYRPASTRSSRARRERR